MAPQPLSPAVEITGDMANLTSVFIGHGANPEKHQSKLLHIYLEVMLLVQLAVLVGALLLCFRVCAYTCVRDRMMLKGCVYCCGIGTLVVVVSLALSFGMRLGEDVTIPLSPDKLYHNLY